MNLNSAIFAIKFNICNDLCLLWHFMLGIQLSEAISRRTPFNFQSLIDANVNE